MCNLRQIVHIYPILYLKCSAYFCLQNETYGETGHVIFDEEGKRDNFTLFVTALSGDHNIYTVSLLPKSHLHRNSLA
jgi:hypothetical protein